MASLYPGAIDTFTDPSGASSLATGPDHAADHTLIHSSTKALENTLGTTLGTALFGAYAVADKPLRHQGGTVQQVMSGTLNNGVLGTPTMVVGSDATGDLHYRSAGGTITRVGIGASGQYLSTNGTTPLWQAGISFAQVGTLATTTANTSLTSITGGTITISPTRTVTAQINMSGDWRQTQSGTIGGSIALLANGTVIQQLNLIAAAQNFRVPFALCGQSSFGSGSGTIVGQISTLTGGTIAVDDTMITVVYG